MPEPARVSAASRLPGLDFLRAFAIVWVMLTHGGMFGLIGEDNWFAGYGWMGVDLFFALSGFLIAGQLLRPWARGESPNYPRFFARRLLRTLPAYLVVVALYFLFPVLQDRDQIQPLWRFLTFTQNLGPNPAGKSFSHAWSLCVEEQFYLVLPVAVALLAWRATSARITGVVVGLIALEMALRGYLWLADVAARPFDITSAPHAGAYMELIYYPTWSRLDDLIGGICAALTQVFKPTWWEALARRGNLLTAIGVIGVAAVMLLFRDGEVAGFFAATFGFPLLALSMSLLVIAGASRRALIGRWAIPGAGALAAGAFSLYLSHKIVFHQVGLWSQSWPQAEKGLAFAVAFVAAAVVAAALYWLVERPFLQLRDRFRDGAKPALRVATEPAAVTAP